MRRRRSTRLSGTDARPADGAGDETPDRTERFWLLVTGLLLVTMPAFTLVVAYAVLLATRSALVGEVGAVEVVELYLIELGAFALFGFLLYRLTGFASRRQGRARSRRDENDDGDRSDDADPTA